MEAFLTNLVNGLSLGSIFLLFSLGLNITFGMMGVINFAHGEFLMIGAYVTYIVARVVPGYAEGAGILLAIALAFLLAGGLGYLLERTVIKRLYGSPFEGILVTWGASLVLQQAARSAFGAQNVDVASPRWLAGGLRVTERFQIPNTRLFIFCLVVLVMTAMYLFLYRTRQGRSMQAVMQNRDMAACLGIRIRNVDAITFGFGSGLAGVAGSVVTLLGSVGPSTGQNYIIDSFMVVVLGGVGSLGGTIAGALMMGMASPFFEYLTTSSMGKVIVFALVILFLQKRPQGLVPRRVRALD